MRGTLALSGPAAERYTCAEGQSPRTAACRGHEKAAGGCGADTDHGAARAEYVALVQARKTLAACELVNT